MANYKDALKRNIKHETKAKRKERVETKAKEYNKKVSNTDKAYIEGNYNKVSSNRAYGYKQALKKGEFQRGDENDWLSDGAIRNGRNVKYDSSWNGIGSKYGTGARKSFLDTNTYENGKFKDRLKTFKMDGLEIAKSNQRKGEPLRNTFEYAVGIGKDLIGDPIMDAMKTIDLGAGALIGAGSGLLEQSGNLISSLAEGKNNFEKGLIKNNVKESLKRSGETGFGTGFGDAFKDVVNKNNAKYGKQLTDKEQKRQDFILDLAGFGGDIISGGVSAKDLLDTGKDIAKGTTKATKTVNTAIKAQNELGRVASIKGSKNIDELTEALRKARGASDDVFFSGKGNKSLDNTAIDRRLNKSYDNAIIKTGKSSLDNFVAKLGAKDIVPISDVNKNLNKLENPIPQSKIRRRSNVTEPVDMSNMKYKIDMEGRTAGNLDKEYKTLLTKQGDDLIDAIDEMPLKQQDEVYDYIRNRDPELYESLVYESDEIEKFAQPFKMKDGETMKGIDPKVAQINVKSDINKTIKDNITRNEAYNKKLAKDSQILSNKKKLYDGYLDFLKKNNPEKAYEMQKGTSKGSLYKQRVKDMFEPKNIMGEHSGRAVEIGKYAREILPKINKGEIKDYKKVITELDNIMFDGKGVIRQNLTEKGTRDLKEFLTFLSQSDGTQQSLNKMSKDMYKFEKGLTDFYYDKKMEKLFKDYPFKIEVNNMPKELEKWQGKTGVTQARKFKNEVSKIYKDKEIPANVKQELNRLDNLEKERASAWTKYRDMSEDEWYFKFGDTSQTKGYNEAREEYAINDLRNSQFDYNKNVRKLDTGEKVRMGGDSAIIDNGREIKIGSDNLNEDIGYKELYDARKKLGLNYVNIKKQITIPKNKQTYKNVIANKDVKNSLANLKKLINEELKYLTKSNTVDTTPIHNIRSLINENVKYLDKLGVDRNVYFNKVKEYKLNAIKDQQVAYTKRSNLPFDKIGKNESKNILDNLGIKLNGKNVNTSELSNLTADELQAKYLFTEGAKTIDELFEPISPKTPQRGDNLGNEISSMLRTNKETNTPLETMSPFEEFVTKDYERELKSQIKKGQIGTNKEEVVRKPKTDEQIKSIDDKLNLIKDTYGDINVKDTEFVDVPSNVNPETGEILNSKISKNSKKPSILDKIATTFKELTNSGIDVTQQPPKTKPEGMSDSLYKRWLTSWKKGVTVYNPGWHVQNYFQNKGQNYIALGNKALESQKDARNVLKQIKGKKYNSSKKIAGRSIEEIGELAQQLGVVDGFIGDSSSSRGIFRGLENAVDNSKPMQKLGEVEQTARLHHFVKRLEEGMSPEEASKSVNKFLYDYGDKSKIDKTISDYIDPFWMFHKNNARMLGQSAVEHPFRTNMLLKANRDLQPELSEEDAQNEGSMWREFQDPTKSYTDEKGRQYNYLYDQNMFPTLADAVPMTPDSATGKLNPLLQIALRTSKLQGKFGNELTESKATVDDGWTEMLYEDGGFGKTPTKVALKETLLDVNPFMPTMVNAIDKSIGENVKVDNGKMEEEIANKRILNEWLKYITGHKGNWYRNLKEE